MTTYLAALVGEVLLCQGGLVRHKRAAAEAQTQTHWDARCKARNKGGRRIREVEWQELIVL